MKRYVNLIISREIGKKVPFELYKKLPEKLEYETAIEIIKEIQLVINHPSYDYKTVYEKISYILDEHNVFFFE